MPRLTFSTISTRDHHLCAHKTACFTRTSPNVCSILAYRTKAPTPWLSTTFLPPPTPPTNPWGVTERQHPIWSIQSNNLGSRWSHHRRVINNPHRHADHHRGFAPTQGVGHGLHPPLTRHPRALRQPAAAARHQGAYHRGEHPPPRSVHRYDNKEFNNGVSVGHPPSCPPSKHVPARYARMYPCCFTPAPTRSDSAGRRNMPHPMMIGVIRWRRIV